MFMLEYEWRFQDLSMFGSYYIPTEQYLIKRLREGFRHELKQGLIALQYATRELIEATQALETCMSEGQQDLSMFGGKKKILISQVDHPS